MPLDLPDGWSRPAPLNSEIIRKDNMDFFDSLAAGWFKTTGNGKKLFFPFVRMGHGYLIQTEGEYQKLRRTVKIYSIVSILLPVSATRLGLLVGLFVATIIFVLYNLWVFTKIRHMKGVQEKLTLKDNMSNIAREMNWLYLLLLELGSIGFVLGGVFLFITDPKRWLLALVSILGFGLCAFTFGRAIAVKRKQGPDI